MLFSGIDLHKRTIAVHTVDAEGIVVRGANLATQRGALTAYFATLPGRHRAVVECTGMWYWVRDLLCPQGIDRRLGHAKYLKAISYAKVKTDAVDAATLAQLLRVDLIPEAHMISAAQRETRDLLRARLVLVGRVLRCQRSVGALLEKYNFATPAALPELPRLQAALHTEQRTLLMAQIRRLEHTLRDRVLATPNAQRLVWVRGIGKLVAYTLLLEIDDIHRFPTVWHFHSYCRLVPGAQDSGGKTRHKPSRDGNRYLKIAFHHAAIRAIQYFAKVRLEYQRLVRRKGKRIARARIAKELATIVYAMLSKEEAFNGKFCGHILTRTKRPTWPRLASPPA
jgi:transposase